MKKPTIDAPVLERAMFEWNLMQPAWKPFKTYGQLTRAEQQWVWDRSLVLILYHGGDLVHPVPREARAHEQGCPAEVREPVLGEYDVADPH